MIRVLYLLLLAGPSPDPTPPPTAPPPPASTGMKIEREIASSKELSLELGQNRLMETSMALGRVSVANPDVADLKVVTSSQLLITAKSVGDTYLTLWDKFDRAMVMSLHVTRNLDAIRSQLHDLFPNESVTVSVAGDLVVLSGEVSDVRIPERILSVARLHAPKVANLLQVRGNQQVQLEVKFAEVSRSGMRELGLNFFHSSAQRSGGIASPSRPMTTGIPGAFPPTPAPAFFESFNLFFSTMGAFPFSVALSLLERNALAKTLAEPTLVAMTGQEARFLAGGEFPIPVSVNIGQISVQFKKFGIQLTFLPTVLADDLISLKMAAVVSELDPQNGIVISGITIPGLSSRESETTVRLRDGQSFAVAGMLSDRVRSHVDKVPGLGEIPILGALFRSQRYRRDETELLVVITAHLVRPLGSREAPVLPGQDELNDPGDLELFLFGWHSSKPHLKPARNEAIPVAGHRGGPAGDVGFMR